MKFLIAKETPLQNDVRQFVDALNAFLTPLSPPEFQFQMTVEQMDDSETTVFVARDKAGRALGMGALKFLGEVDGAILGEVKRMFTIPEVRGQRVGVQLLKKIEMLALELGITQLKLETGATKSMAPAHRLYINSGFAPCDPFLGYPESKHSAFFEKRLSA